MLLLVTSIVAAELPQPPEPQAAQQVPLITPEPVAARTDWLSFHADTLHTEFGVLTERRAAADGQFYLRAQPRIEARLGSAWSLRLQPLLESWHELGLDDAQRTRLDSAESYLRYRNTRREITLGAQFLRWGRVDHEPPLEIGSRMDLIRLPLDDWHRQRRSVLALNWREWGSQLNYEALLIPIFRPSRLPDRDSIWYPINQRNGRFLGIRPSTGLSLVGRLGTIDDSYPRGRFGGAGLRVGQETGRLEWHLAVQNLRRAQPYFEIDRELQPLLPDQISLIDVLRARTRRPTFQVRHPMTWAVGGDLGWSGQRSSWRMEANWSEKLPVTSSGFRMITPSALDWAVAWERFFGTLDARISLQLRGRDIFADRPVLDRYQRVALLGDAQINLARGRWSLRLRFLEGLLPTTQVLNPEIARITEHFGSWYLGYHRFAGSSATPGEFYADNDLIVAGWRWQP
ncbi:MAG: hypothetical protein RQ729_01020 [Wenzhouxiangellaceae bacterium]|nr:hypothetical protein [Wenzhouxiangellaceae bacterium]